VKQPDAATTLSIVRQQVDPGVHSIRSLRVVGDPGNIAASSSIKLFGWPTVPPMMRPMPAAELAVRVTVRFRDGGAPLVVDREAVSQPYGPAGVQMGVSPSYRLITVEDILAPSSREVLSISVQAMPEGIDCISSMRVIIWIGRTMAAGEAGASAEYTPDGGATWLPLLTPEGEKLQAAAYAYAWEKIQTLPTVDAFIYHRHVDHAHEGGLRLGLWRNAPHSVADPHSKKLIYDLFKKAGTPEWRAAADALLPVTGWKTWSE
jgi:hypothetical protein